jgi:hypothetical protein
MSAENEKNADTKPTKLRKRSEGDKEEEVLEIFDVESTAEGMGGSGD